MADDPFLAEIKLISFNFPPKGWAFCNGQLLQINQNQALFSLLGTTYGGDGRTTFALPNLQGRLPLHVGSGFSLGERAGEDAHTLDNNEMPAHNHQVTASANPADQASPAGNLWANGGQQNYTASPPNVQMNQAAITSVGGSQPHNNQSPYLVLNYVIALQGIYPSQN